MRTFSKAKGLPVFTENGDRIGTVCDFTLADGQVSGLLMERKAFIDKTRFIPLAQITSFGSESVIVAGMPEGKPPREALRYRHDDVFGRLMLSECGEELGLLHDVYFQEKMGTIVAYETTDGFFSELTEGKRLIRSASPPALGDDAIIVSVEQ